MHKRARGYQAEQIAIQFYEDQGWELLHRNFTIVGGEIDAIFKKNYTLVFLEVKDVSHIDDLQDYITLSKRRTLKKTIHTYLYKLPCIYDAIRCDIIFIKYNKVHSVIENCVDL